MSSPIEIGNFNHLCFWEATELKIYFKLLGRNKVEKLFQVSKKLRTADIYDFKGGDILGEINESEK